MSRLGTRNRAALVVALAGGENITAAAQLANISRRTVHRLLKDDAFRHEVATVRSDLICEATGRLARLAGAAVDKLQGLLDSPTETIQLSAARCVLTTLATLRQDEELSSRMQALEERLDQVKVNGFAGRLR